MTIFLSHRPNLDPEPWREPGRHGLRSAHKFGNDDVFDPRPEFELTRDPAPWSNGTDHYTREMHVKNPGGSPIWSPRRDRYDTPVNRVLVAFRSTLIAPHNEGLSVAQIAAGWLQAPGFFMRDSTSDEIAHARKVLQHLANLTKED